LSLSKRRLEESIPQIHKDQWKRGLEEAVDSRDGRRIVSAVVVTVFGTALSVGTGGTFTVVPSSGIGGIAVPMAITNPVGIAVAMGCILALTGALYLVDRQHRSVDHRRI
jgi:hypothetical protein